MQKEMHHPAYLTKARFSNAFCEAAEHDPTVDINWKVSGQTVSSFMSTLANHAFLAFFPQAHGM